MNDGELVDGHHHLWDTNELHYKLFDEVAALRRPYTLSDYERDPAGATCTRSICVEAASAGAEGAREIEWLLRHTAAPSNRVAGIVAWAPLDQAELPTYLDQLTQLDGKPIVGVRRSFEFEPADFAQRTGVIAGARTAGEYGLVVDLVLFAPALRAATALVDACPGTQFVLDHLGKPPIRLNNREPWQTEIAELALRPNVVAKLSGLSTEANRGEWQPSEIQPYVEHAVNCFGTDRLLYGSDWPVVNLAGGAERWLAALDSMLQSLSLEERHSVFRANAERVYKISSDARVPDEPASES